MCSYISLNNLSALTTSQRHCSHDRYSASFYAHTCTYANPHTRHCTHTHRDRKSPSDDIRLGAVEYPNFLVGYFNVIKLFDHPFCHTVSPHSVTSKRRPTCTCTLILYDTIHVQQHVHVQQSLFRLFYPHSFFFFLAHLDTL